jgi:hypothetical protein
MSDQINWDEPDEDMAPHDLKWHRQYSKTFAIFSSNLELLKAHPAFEGAEDLGDYVDTISHLLSFRPHTRTDIEKDVYTELFGEDVVAQAEAQIQSMMEGEYLRA